MKNINIKGIDKVKILKALWKNSKPAAYVEHNNLPPLDFDDDLAKVAVLKYVDYFQDRIIQCDLSGDECVPSKNYDEDVGKGTFMKAVNEAMHPSSKGITKNPKPAKVAEKAVTYLQKIEEQKSDVERYCKCGNLVPERIVRKEGPNLGREFYSCTTCDFFEWKTDGNDDNIDCDCKQTKACVRVVKKEGPNKGRTFYCCAKKMCGFFKWK